MRRKIAPIALGMAVAGCGAPEHGEIGSFSEGVTVCAGGSTIQGIDVSQWQGSINWSQVHASGRAFAITRIADGTYQDPYFGANWGAIKQEGMVRGAYHFYEAGTSATAQASVDIAAVGQLGPGDLPVTADLESGGGVPSVSELQTWMAAVESGTGKKPMIYTSPGYWDSYYGSQFSGNPIWVADWGPSCPDTPTGWSNWQFWQYADNGSVPGISGAVDLDEFNGDATALGTFAGGGGSVSCTNPLGHGVGTGSAVSGPCGGTPALPPAPSSCGSMSAGEGLGPGASVTSCDGRFQLVMQTDGNVVLYAHGIALWATGTNGKGGYLFVMQGDGNLVLYSNAGCPMWASNTSGHPGAFFAVQSDGNLVIYTSAGTPLWSSGTGPIPPAPSTCGKIASGEGLGPGDSVSSCLACFTFVMQGDGNLVLYHNGNGAIWATGTNGKNGYALEMQSDGNLVLYSNVGCPLWDSGTYNNPGAWAAVQDDGNLVVYSPAGSPLWSSSTVVCNGGCASCLPPPPPPPPDAGVPPPPPVDAGSRPPPHDAGIAPHEDAGPSLPADSGHDMDAGMSDLDSGTATPNPGSATNPPGTEATPVKMTGGFCGCATGPDSVSGLALLLSTVAGARRRRRR
jgi:GH25 family lysozyme M1 (1,4-beta-N-acetylmuramidase)